MTSKTTYYCEYCGKAFESKEECEKHEYNERYSAREKDLHLWNEKWERLPLTSSVNHIYNFYAETDEAFDFVEKMHRAEEFETVSEDSGCAGAGHYFYDGSWHKLEEEEKLLKEIRKEFEDD